ncbi:MAG: phosphoglycerate mutase family protein [Longimicrobiales bacterium]|nr:phosphoglycerate mutase family protein [Longimicrobiales bacterium]
MSPISKPPPTPSRPGSQRPPARPRVAGAVTAAVLALSLLLTSPALHVPPPGFPHTTFGLEAQTGPVVVFLVRHAERAEDGTADPPISEPGEARARLLARMLRDVDLTHIHTTDYVRTRATGMPTARLQGLEMVLYDPDDLDAFARELRATAGRHLVLGHSNTTPELVEALGGDGHGAIEEMEYDRLYIVTLDPSGVSTVLLRFGSDPGG